MAKALAKQPFWGKEFLQFGLNVTDNAIMVPFQYMVEAKNIMVGSTWARRKRPGLAYWNTDTSKETTSYPGNPLNSLDNDPIAGLVEFWRDTGSSQVRALLVRQGSKLWEIDGRTGAATDVPVKSGSTALPDLGIQDTKICFNSYYGVIYWASSNNDEFKYWDGTNYIDATPPPAGNPKFLATYKGRLVAAGFVGAGSRPFQVNLSKVNEADNWTTGTGANDGVSFVVDDVGDPDGVTGLCTFQNRLYVFLRRGIFSLSGTTGADMIRENVVTGIGAINNNCILPIGNDVYFLSERGLLSLKSSDKAITSEYGYMSRDIAKIYNEQLDRSKESRWTMEYDENENLLLISCTSVGSVENDIVLVYNTEKNVWTTWENINARSLAKVLVDRKSKILAGQENGTLALMGESLRKDFETIDYQSQFLTGIYYPGKEADIEHVFEEVTVLCSAESTATLTVQISIDSDILQTETLELNTSGSRLTSTFVLGSSVLGKSVFTPKTIKLNGGRGFGIQVRVIFPSSIDVEFYGVLINSRPAGNRREI